MRSARWGWLLLGLLILWPQVCNESAGPPYLGPPQIFGRGTDEEGYLVLINSAVRDGDLDLKNNYDALPTGSLQAGRVNGGRPTLRHSTYWINGVRKVWHELPALGIDPRARGGEYSSHPVGIALLLGPLLWPVRERPEWVESGALLCAGLATVLAAWLYRGLLARLSADRLAVAAAVVAVFLGSPAWFYSRTLFMEPFVLLGVVGALAAALQGRMVLAGGWVAGAMLLKPQEAMLAAILAGPALLRRDWRQVAALAAAPTAALAVLLGLNWHMYGAPLHGPYPFTWGANPAAGVYGLLLGQERGLVWLTPALLLAPFGWWRLRSESPLAAWTASAGAIFHLALAALWSDWAGGWCVGPRLIVPALPLFGVGLLKVIDAPALRRRVGRAAIGVVIAYALVVNGAEASRYWITWTTAGGPLKVLSRILS